MPRDQWTKTLPSGEQVCYSYEFEPEAGGVITATRGEIKKTAAIRAPMTREQVETELGEI